MGAQSSIWSLFAATLLFLRLGRLVNAQSACTLKSGCSVDLDNGVKIDFCSIFDNGALNWFEGGTGSTFLYDGKTPIFCETAGTALCLTFPNGMKFNIGALGGSNMQCTMVSADPSSNSYTMNIIYPDTAKSRQGSVKVECQGGWDTVQTFKYVADTQYNFILQLTSSSPPSSAGDVAGIPGIILIVLFLAAVVTYVVVGVLVMKYWKGAQGVELIPNYHFWKDFPFLVKLEFDLLKKVRLLKKDGIVFSFTAWPCCKGLGYKKL